jgi:hypothetical protein
MDPDSAALVELASRRDAPCPVCDYNLRGIVEPRCPECGAGLRLEIGSENLRLGPWLLALLGPALAAGFDAVVSTLMTVMFALHPPRGPGPRVFVLTILGTFVALAVTSGLAIGWIVRRRKAWHRRPLRAQWRSALVILGTVFIVHAVFGFSLTRVMN